MVDTKAEEDDEEGFGPFGDFTFASFPTLPSDHQINGRKSTDDEWGDFVVSPLRSDLSNTHSTPNPSKPFDPFGFFSDHSTKPPQSVPTPTQSEKSQWTKPRGALPLSIFGGEEEEEEQSGVVVPTVKDSVGEKNGSSNVRNASNMFVGFAVNDLIANLYNQNQQIKTENGSNLNPNMNGLAIASSGLNSNSNSDLFSGNVDSQSPSRSNSDVFAGKNDSQSPQIKAVNGLNLNSNWDLFSGNINSQSPLSSNSDRFSGKNDSQTPHNKAVKGLNSNSDSDLFSGNMDSQIPLSSNSDVFAGKNDNQSPQIKAVDGLNSNSDFFTGNNGSQGQQIKAGIGLNSYSSGMDLSMDFFSGNNDFDSFADLYSKSQQNRDENTNAVNSNLNSSTLDLSGKNLNFVGLNSNAVPQGENEEFDGDDDGWEFKDAYSEAKVEDGNDKVSGKEHGISEVAGFSPEFDIGSQGYIDLFSASNGFASKPREMDFGFALKPPTAQNGFNSESFFKSEQNGTENGLNSDPVLGTVDSDESFGDFEGAFTGTGSKQEDEPEVNDLSHSEVKVLTPDRKVQGNETMSESHKGALPLSIFGDEELEIDDSLSVQDAFTFKPSSQQRNGINSQGSNISIHDLLSNLYSQAEQIPSVENREKLDGNELDSSNKMLNPRLMNCDDDFDDVSWEFKEASSQTRAVDQTYFHSPGDAHEKISTKLKLNNCVDFYSKLKDELSLLCRCHLDSLKKAQNAASLSGEDAKVATIEKEIQEAHKELQKENINSEEHLEHQPTTDICLNEILGVLHELKFQVLESEYHLSRRAQLAEKDLRSAIELIKHTTSMLKVLTLGSVEDQYIYVSTWSKMISVCAQELKHGCQIWQQFVEKDLLSWILSEPRGKRFILALGEIYRVIVIIGASTKLYKPWILSHSEDSTRIYALLEECYILWSSSGIKDAVHGISDPIDFEYHSTAKALWESIKYTSDLDALALRTHVFNQQVSVCRLSLLTSDAVPEMKMVFWTGEYYFLTLANLWANLISCDPPELPHLHVAS